MGRRHGRQCRWGIRGQQTIGDPWQTQEKKNDEEFEEEIEEFKEEIAKTNDRKPMVD